MIDIGTLYTKIDADTRPLKRAESDIKGFAKKAGVALAAIYGAVKSAGFIKDATMAAARYDELGVAMYAVGKNAGHTKTKLDDLEKSLRKTGISMIDSRQNISRLIQANIDLGKATDLAKIAQDAAVIAGLDSSETYTRLINGIQRGETELLKTIGINVQFEQAYKDMAKQLGITTNELTAFEKTQARTNIVLKAGADIAGAYGAAMETPGKKLRTLYGRLVKDVQVMLGGLFTPTFKASVDFIYEKFSKFSDAIDVEKIAAWGNTIRDVLVRSFSFLSDAVTGVVDDIKSLDRAMADLFDQDETPLKNIADALKGLASVAAGDLSMKEFVGMDPEDLDKWFDRFDSGVVEIDKKIRQLKSDRRKFQVWSPSISREDALAGMAGIDEQIRNLDEARKRIESGANKKLISEFTPDFETTAFWKDLPGIAARAAEETAGELDRLNRAYQEHADKIKEISDSIADNQLRGAERLRAMSRSNMSDHSAWKDLKAEAGEYARIAEQAIAAGNFDKAAEYAKVAEDKYAALNQEVRDGDKVLVSRASALKAAMNGVSQMVELENKALAGMKQVETAAQNKISEQAQRLSGKENPFGQIVSQAEQAKVKVNEFKAAFDQVALGDKTLGGTLTIDDGVYRNIAKEGAKAEKSAKAFGNALDMAKVPVDGIKTGIGEVSAAVDASANSFDAIIEKAAKLESEYDRIATSMTGMTSGTEEWDAAIEKLDSIAAEIEALTDDKVKALGDGFNKVWEEGEKVSSQTIKSINNGLDSTIAKASRALQIFKEMAAIQPQQSDGGPVGYKLGGMIGAARGRHFPGFGGGDKIPILGEAGEYMINKFAVRDAGVDTAAAFNRGDWETVVNNLSQKMATGGYVGPTQQVSQPQPSAEVPINLYLPGDSKPISIRAEQKQARRIYKAWQDMVQR